MKMNTKNDGKEGECKSSVQRIRKQVTTRDVSYKFPPPANTTHYTLREMVENNVQSKTKISVNSFYIFGTKQVPPTVLCNRATII